MRTGTSSRSQNMRELVASSRICVLQVYSDAECRAQLHCRLSGHCKSWLVTLTYASLSGDASHATPIRLFRELSQLHLTTAKRVVVSGYTSRSRLPAAGHRTQISARDCACMIDMYVTFSFRGQRYFGKFNNQIFHRFFS